MRIKRNLKIKIHWIPAHKGIFYNKVVDKLAKEATKIGSPIDLQIPYTDLFEEKNKKLISRI